MGINSITGPALQGIQKGFQGIRKVASEITNAQQTNQAKPTDLSRAMVELQQHANQTKAQVKTLQTVNDVVGTLIDERV
ncbi:MAG: hydrolase [Candidatus Thiodiazotropha sp. (ex Troendleina suluensis)]|nr:hydrolase [Candidatus Thiodiazotropha sp. (ex Troendleina suluensis)]MCU7858086.1 hydrolase [Candidatus Thiodiazotropha sp. (ex Lucinoma borealis)]MCU7869600.1 hydrolase [Candidatus Thiodiazotropha sp. (ex Lucinoma borealis)]MCU7945119.1 hydrolase [Candidatus Thiodiazotropha sp. (ex Cardiolucina cf. quadrata)]